MALITFGKRGAVSLVRYLLLFALLSAYRLSQWTVRTHVIMVESLFLLPYCLDCERLAQFPVSTRSDWAISGLALMQLNIFRDGIRA